MNWWTVALFLLGACICLLNVHLSFLRYPLHRLRGGTRADFRFVSGIPLLGSLLVLLVWLWWTRSPESTTTTVDVISWTLIAVDTGGLHWFAISLLLARLRPARPDRPSPDVGAADDEHAPRTRAAMARLVVPCGFEPVVDRRGTGSGGHFGELVHARGERRIELWWRGNLLTARYVDGPHVLDHRTYLDLLGAGDLRWFPCSGSIAEQLEALIADLERYGAGFLDAASVGLEHVAAEYAKNPARFRGNRGV